MTAEHPRTPEQEPTPEEGLSQAPAPQTERGGYPIPLSEEREYDYPHIGHQWDEPARPRFYDSGPFPDIPMTEYVTVPGRRFTEPYSWHVSPDAENKQGYWDVEQAAWVGRPFVDDRGATSDRARHAQYVQSVLLPGIREMNESYVQPLGLAERQYGIDVSDRWLDDGPASLLEKPYPVAKTPLRNLLGRYGMGGAYPYSTGEYHTPREPNALPFTDNFPLALDPVARDTKQGYWDVEQAAWVGRPFVDDRGATSDEARRAAFTRQISLPERRELPTDWRDVRLSFLSTGGLGVAYTTFYAGRFNQVRPEGYLADMPSKEQLVEEEFIHPPYYGHDALGPYPLTSHSDAERQEDAE